MSGCSRIKTMCCKNAPNVSPIASSQKFKLVDVFWAHIVIEENATPMIFTKKTMKCTSPRVRQTKIVCALSVLNERTITLICKVGCTAETFGAVSHNANQSVLMFVEHLMNCLVEKLLVYSTGRGLTFGDRRIAHELVEEAINSNLGFQDLIVSVVLSESFLTR